MRYIIVLLGAIFSGSFFLMEKPENQNLSTSFIEHSLLLSNPVDTVREDWVARLDVPGSANDYPTDIVTDLQGNIITTGYRRKLGGNTDYVTVKYDPLGNLLWLQTYDGSVNGFDRANAVAVDESGNVYVTGRSNTESYASEYATIAYSPEGEQLWISRYSGPVGGENEAIDIVVTEYQLVAVTGWSESEDNGLDIATLFYDATDGNQDEVRRYNGPGNLDDKPVEITATANCTQLPPSLCCPVYNIYITASTERRRFSEDYLTLRYEIETCPTRQSRLVWDKIFNSSIDRDDNPVGLVRSGSVLYVAGTSEWVPFGSTVPRSAIVIIKYSIASGNTLWTELLGFSSRSLFARDVDANSSGVYAIGQEDIFGESNYYTFKYSPDSLLLWTKRFNGTGNNADRPVALSLSASGSVYVTGKSANSSFDEDFATIKYNASGEQQWVRTYGNQFGDDDQATGIAVSEDGKIYVLGQTNGSISGKRNDDFALLKYEPDGTERWAQLHDSPGDSDDFAVASLTDEEGNVYLAGNTYTIGSSRQFLTAKFNRRGEIVWFTTYNSPSAKDDLAKAIAIDEAKNVYVAGTSLGDDLKTDYLSIKYNAQGVEQWVARYDGPAGGNDWPVAIATDDIGHVIVTGTSEGNGTDFATLKYDRDGNELWEARYNGLLTEGEEVAVSLGVDAAGNAYIGGYGPDTLNQNNSNYITIKYNASGIEQWVQTYDDDDKDDKITALGLDPFGNVIITGTTAGPDPQDTSNYATIKYNPNGERVWVRRYEGDHPAFGNKEATAMTIDPAGNVYVTGTVFIDEQQTNFATVKYNKAGVTQWRAFYDGPKNSWDQARSLVVDGEGALYVTGTTFDTTVLVGEGDEEDIFDIVTVKYDSMGMQQWSMLYPAQVNQINASFSVGTDNDEHVFVSGYSANFPDPTARDLVVVKYSQSPVVAVRERPTRNTDLFIKAYPSPFNAWVRIQFEIPISNASMTLRVLDVGGREISVLAKGRYPEGIHSLSWDGRGPNGQALPVGIYLLEYRVGRYVKVQKLIRSH